MQVRSLHRRTIHEGGATGTISSAKLAGTSLILGPVITVICYFIQQSAISLSADEWGNAAAAAEKLRSASVLSNVTSLIIPLALTMFVYGIFFILNEIRGNGEALVGFAKIPILIGLAGWVYGSGVGITVTNWPGGDTNMFTLWGLGQISSVMFAIGATAGFLAIASRNDYNSTLAYGAAVVGFVGIITSVVGILTSDGSVAANMTLIVGITYIIHTLYSVYLGRGLLSRS